MFYLNNSLLRNVGQAWNFFALLGCSNMTISDELIGGKNFEGLYNDDTIVKVNSLSGVLPNGKRIRYMELGTSNDNYTLSKSMNEFRHLYNSTTRYENVIAFLKLHFALEIEYNDIIDIRCGDAGCAVTLKIDDRYCSLELITN